MRERPSIQNQIQQETIKPIQATARQSQMIPPKGPVERWNLDVPGGGIGPAPVDYLDV